jgi:hypothetical protein
MSGLYCGPKDDIPKGKKRGSMKECVENGQYSYFGLNKIDKKLLKKSSSAKKGKRELMKEWLKVSGLKGKYVAQLTKLKKQIEVEKNAKKKKELETKKADLLIKYKEIIKQDEKLSKKYAKEYGPKRQISRKSSKKSSRKSFKKSSKKSSK